MTPRGYFDYSENSMEARERRVSMHPQKVTPLLAEEGHLYFALTPALMPLTSAAGRNIVSPIYFAHFPADENLSSPSLSAQDSVRAVS